MSDEFKQLEAGSDWVDPRLNMTFIWIETLGIWVGRHAVTNGEFRQWQKHHDSGEFRGHSLNLERQPVSRRSLQKSRD